MLLDASHGRLHARAAAFELLMLQLSFASEAIDPGRRGRVNLSAAGGAVGFIASIR